MPVKNKKVVAPKETYKEPVKKFVVEEKTEDSQKDNLNTSVKVAEPDDIPTPEFKEDNVQISSTLNTDEKPQEESSLKSDSEKDTLPSTNLTSFSLLDSDKKESDKKSDMQENIKEAPQNESAIPSTSGDLPIKSSQDEVNKWIENYDEKEDTGKKKGSGFFKTFLIILTILSLAAAIAGGVYYYQKNIAGGKKEEAEETAENKEEAKPTALPTQEPTKEEAKAEYSKYTLQILNGSGIPGEAGKVKDLIKDLKFKSVVTGNASSYDFEKTVIAIKESIPSQVFTDIKDLLGETYDLESKSELLKDTSNYDVVITVGIKK